MEQVTEVMSVENIQNKVLVFFNKRYDIITTEWLLSRGSR